MSIAALELEGNSDKNAILTTAHDAMKAEGLSVKGLSNDLKQKFEVEDKSPSPFPTKPQGPRTN